MSIETPTKNPETDTPGLVEQNQRLSQSMLWQAQRDYFTRQGIEAWRRGTVPHYVTSNPFIAQAYAQVVLGFLRDCRAGDLALDPGRPIYIIELGAGSGRFAFHFLKQFLAVYRQSALKDLPVQYVMTDFTEQTLAYWQDHPRLQPLVAEGWLDFARFDAGHDRELRLINAGQTLAPGSVNNPMVVLANYFFDGLPQDAFYIRAGQLYESLISLTAPQADLSDPETLEQLEINYEQRPVNGDYYADAVCNRILQGYRQRLDDTALLFPCTAIRCLRDLAQIAGGQLLLLSADKGYSREEDLQGRGEPGLARHGSFSMMVNYHALGLYVEQQGGQALHPGHRHTSLNVSAFLLGRPAENAVETRLAYASAIDRFSPDDFFTLKKGIEQIYNELTLPQILALLRLSGWDAKLFMGCFANLLDRVDSLSATGRQALYEAIQQVWDTYYPLGEARDLAFDMGMLLYGMAYYAEALEFFGHSLQLYGPEASTVYNMGMCHYGLGQLEAALDHVDQALALDPAFDAAREMRQRQGSLKSQSQERHAIINRDQQKGET